MVLHQQREGHRQKNHPIIGDEMTISLTIQSQIMSDESIKAYEN